MDKDNLRILKNTLMLYIRMLFAMSVALYTSRIVLNELGVEDFGIYGVVGGIVTMLMFLNGSMSTATSRFLAFEIGKGDVVGIKETFKAATAVHFFLAICIFVLAETVGLWFLETKLVIPEARMNAARIVYQLSILSCLISVTQAPYNAVIIAHEKMEVYAVITIIDSLLKLVIVFLLSCFHFDKLILYSVLVFIVFAIICSIYRIYCAYKFSECRFSLFAEKKRFKSILFFSGWNLLGSLGGVFRGQGINMLQNIFFGTIVNASTSIANQFFAALSTFSDSFLAAIRPQIVKNYAIKNYTRVESLIINASRFAFMLLALFAIPLVLECQFVLSIWLKNVPPYAVSFCQLNVLLCLLFIIFQPVIYSIQATGNIKSMNILIGIGYMLILPVSYLFFRMGYSPLLPYQISLVVFLVIGIGSLFVLKRYMHCFNVRRFVQLVYIRCVVVFVLSFALSYGIHNCISDNSVLRFIFVLLSSFVFIPCFSYIIVLDESMKKNINIKLREFKDKFI